MHPVGQKRRNHWHLPLLEFNLFSWCIALCKWLEVRVPVLIKQREESNEDINDWCAASRGNAGRGCGRASSSGRTAAAHPVKGEVIESECVRQPRRLYLQRRRGVRDYLQCR